MPVRSGVYAQRMGCQGRELSNLWSRSHLYATGCFFGLLFYEQKMTSLRKSSSAMQSKALPEFHQQTYPQVATACRTAPQPAHRTCDAGSSEQAVVMLPVGGQAATYSAFVAGMDSS